MQLFGKVISVLFAIGVVATMTFAGVTPASAQPGGVWVDDDWAGSIPGDPVDGHTFGTDAFAKIQHGIDAVASPGTVHVAAGSYVENITLKDGVEVLGAGADVTTIDGGKADSVVKADAVGSNTVIDGFTITNGSASFYGGGIHMANSALNVTNNAITHNTAGVGGGGIAVLSNSSATIRNNIISDNSTMLTGANAGGILVYAASATIKNNTVTDNTSYKSGAIHVQGSTDVVANVTIAANMIHANISSSHAGAIFIFPISSALIANNVITANVSDSGMGGSILVWTDMSVTIINNTIIGNRAGGSGGGIARIECSPVITNCIIWDNGDDLGGYGEGSFLVTYSDIEDGAAGEGNISAAPMFVDTINNDYHLQPDSPCIDSGTNNAELPDKDKDGKPRVIDGNGDGESIVDMGAYEFGDICKGDFNHDGDVDGSDLALFAADFGRTDCSPADPCEGDFDSDGDVDGSDLAVFAADFGRTDCPE